MYYSLFITIIITIIIIIIIIIIIVIIIIAVIVAAVVVSVGDADCKLLRLLSVDGIVPISFLSSESLFQ